MWLFSPSRKYGFCNSATVALAAAAVTIGGRLGLEKSPQDKEERIGNQFFQNHRRAVESDYLSLA